MTQLSTANLQETITMRTAVKLLACSVGLLPLASAQAAPNVVSDPVGFYKVTINEGANFISAPLHKVHAYRGVVASVSGNTITFNGNPNFTANQFAPVTSPAPRNQFIAIVRNSSGSNTGDWWTIQSNTGNSITVDPGADTMSSATPAGTQIEIRKLTSFKDLFGSGADYVLIKSADNLPSPATEDVIRFVNGTSFGAQVIYSSLSDSYRIGSQNWGDGSTLTIEPDEPILVFRKAGAGPTNIVSLGQVQVKPLTHYFQEGANTFSSVFPVNANWVSSGLAAAGMVGSTDLLPNANTEDIIRKVNGTSFDTPIILYTVDGTFRRSGANADPANNAKAAAGYIFFRKSGAGPLVWRQTVPFTP
jgi:uncharacterized protein (TIGR02597 family)